MNQERWTAVDDYLQELLITHDQALSDALKDSEAAELPSIQVSPNQGRLLQVMARSYNARRILEVGTLGGYSTIWLARALPEEGKLITLEINPKHAAVAQKNLERAGQAAKVELRLGRGVDLMAKLVEENQPPFDLVFIDADKASTKEYIEWSLRLTRPGSIIIVDNVMRKGHVIDSDSDDVNIQGMRRALDTIAAEPRLLAAGVQTVGSKGYDGFVLACVIEE